MEEQNCQGKSTNALRARPSFLPCLPCLLNEPKNTERRVDDAAISVHELLYPARSLLVRPIRRRRRRRAGKLRIKFRQSADRAERARPSQSQRDRDRHASASAGEEEACRLLQSRLPITHIDSYNSQSKHSRSGRRVGGWTRIWSGIALRAALFITSQRLCHQFRQR